ncbi:MAG TPA: FlgD immunoglobulin-like domain containing protein, partial [Candidatus Cloacimonadota bacterium]|nr:FlgD immunoglobulin-like domain containing protein [Candidatus Cloacimonadota bacterium]
WQQTTTVEGVGSQISFEQTDRENPPVPATHMNSRDSRVALNWQTSDAAAICGNVCVSSETANSFVEWYLNNERASLYHDSSNPICEYTVGNLDFEYPIDMTEDGSVLAIGNNTSLEFFDTSSAVPTWQNSINYTISGLVLSPNGDKVYISYVDPNTSMAYVECYEYGVATAEWSVFFEGGSSTLGISGDGSTLIFTQYGGGHSNMWVLDTNDGSLIFQGPEYNQNAPAICYDASIIVNGDYSGYVHVYQYNSDLDTYEEIWLYSVDGGGTSDWIGGMAISADGSTIAVGTLTFLSSGYNGQIYLFNSYSPTPVWIYDNVGDYVVDVDLTDDGSLLAAASYGPLNHTTADFLLFRRECNVPIYEINTPGSLETVDIAGDGSFCTTGGKAVHAREMGSGGLLYNIDTNLGGGFVTGIVNLEGSEDNSGVKVEIPDLTGYYDYTDYDGNFSINNVPAGTYSVDYVKIGYIANTSTNVVVTDGETTDLGVINMLAFGSAPLNLVASQGSDIFVTLTWDAPAGGTVEGYNIYRKVYDLDPFPEEPLATVGADELTFIDDTAFPLYEYYYVITGVLTGGMQSPYSNVEQGWISTGFVASEISAYEGITPTIDGTISAGEWDDAYRLDSSDFWGSYDNSPVPIGSVIGYFKVNAAMTELYVAYINYNDPILEDHDEVALYIDDNNDGVYATQEAANEGNYWAAYYAAGNQMIFRPIYNTGGVGTNYTFTDPQVAASDATGYVVFEFIIPIGTEAYEINPNADNQSGIAIFVLDDNSPSANDFDGWWPLDNTNLFDASGFGPITFNVDPQAPAAPENVTLENNEIVFELNWDMPAMNDFDHFNVYYAFNSDDFDLIDTTVGTQYFYDYTYVPSSTYRFYLTTVNQMGMESAPSTIVEYVSVENGNPVPQAVTKLNGNYPNPFNPTTTINFSVAESSEKTQITIYNLKGQKVKELVNGHLEAGEHSVTWNGSDDNGKQTASGIYFYKMSAGGYYTCTKKMILLK